MPPKRPPPELVVDEPKSPPPVEVGAVALPKSPPPEVFLFVAVEDPKSPPPVEPAVLVLPKSPPEAGAFCPVVVDVPKSPEEVLGVELPKIPEEVEVVLVDPKRPVVPVLVLGFAVVLVLPKSPPGVLVLLCAVFELPKSPPPPVPGVLVLLPKRPPPAVGAGVDPEPPNRDPDDAIVPNSKLLGVKLSRVEDILARHNREGEIDHPI